MGFLTGLLTTTVDNFGLMQMSIADLLASLVLEPALALHLSALTGLRCPSSVKIGRLIPIPPLRRRPI